MIYLFTLACTTQAQLAYINIVLWESTLYLFLSCNEYIKHIVQLFTYLTLHIMAISFSKSSEKTFFPVLSPLTKVISFSSIDLSKQKLWTGQKLWLSVYRNFFSLSFVCPKAPPINYIIVWRKTRQIQTKKSMTVEV